MGWKDKLVEPAINFLKNAEREIAIIYGHDCDSIASASLIYKISRDLNVTGKLIVSEFNFEVDEKTIEVSKKYENVVIVDIGDTPEERIEKLSKVTKLLVIDHHIPKKYNCVYVNPREFKKNVYMPVSYINWLIYRKIFDDINVLWIAGFGTLGDFGAKYNKDLFLRIRKYKKELVGSLKIDDRVLMEKSLLGKITRMIDSCRIFGGIKGVEYAARVVAESESYNDVLLDKRINLYFRKLEREFEKEVKRVKENSVILGDFLIYELKSKCNLKSSLASYLPKLYKDKIIFIAQKNKHGFYEVSVRRGLNRKVDLSKLVKKICENTSAKGGGHPTAAGMRIDKIEEIFEFVKKQKKRKAT